jgi:NADH-quinone oxidoreductase subunit N
VLLYGFSFLYGAAGSTRLEHIAAALAQSSDQAPLNTTLVPIALLLLFAGLAFRLTAVPFHFYAPDVYQGTSNANAGLLSTLPKIAGLLVLARILLTAMPGWESLGWKVTLVVSILTMTIGNVLALWQTNLRRLLAYSSVAHAGYILIGLSVALAAKTVALPAAADPAAELKSSATASANPTTSSTAPATPASTAAADASSVAALAESAATEGAGINGLGASLFYLAVYMFATLGAFAALVYLGRGERQVDSLDELAGLNRSHPVVAIMMAVFMFSLAGIPPLAGFWGKFTLLYGALTLPEFSQDKLQLRPWFIGLAIVAALNAAIAAAYYLRVISTMYFRSPESAARTTANEGAVGRSWGPAIAMALCVALVLGIGLMPSGVLDDAVRAGSSIRQPNGEKLPTKIAAVEKR